MGKYIYSFLILNWNYFLNKNIIYKKFKDVTHKPVVVLPECLVPFAIAMYHLKTHGGAKKLFGGEKNEL